LLQIIIEIKSRRITGAGMRNEQGRREIHTGSWWRNLRRRHWWSWQAKIEIGLKENE
jgi:hypothetical protein